MGRPHQNSKPGESFKWKREKDDMNTRIKSAVDILSAMGTGSNGVIFLKHMAKHCSLYDFEKDIETHGSATIIDVHKGVQIKHKHVILIRDPVSMLFSWDAASTVHNSNITPNELGIVQLLSIYSDVKSRTDGNGSICVLDSDDLASSPKKTLEALCNDLDIPFMTQMLSWKNGPHKCDGPWADWWYEDVHKSSGWSAGITQRYRTLDRKMLPALKASLSAYNFFKHLTHGYRTRGPPPKKIYEDPRNEDSLVYIGAPGHGRLIPREFAGVSPWDSSVQGGDATWEGIRVYRGKILSLDKHLRRLFKSARALGFVNVHSKEEVVTAIFRCLAVNGMRDGAHMRLTLTRGEKCTSSMNPAFNVYGTTLIVLAEWKPTEGKTTYDNSKGISLITSSVRRNSPSTCDSKIHHNNMINNILPKIQANLAGAADALMLDVDGFVSETNATNVFMVDDGVLMTPHADHCLPGITRETVLMLAEEIGIKTQVRRISLAEFHSADEVFTTGTMGELTPVTMIDGRKISDGKKGVLTQRLQEVYSTLPERPGWATEIPQF
eukprot:CAMPEP_0194272750 /NCGR_PEP_ID=MMETSP0169-20130528/6228_1 /TAXON_ID=218684 /ORGANISM="Corethron pennatum, Strain L29A3" /LENGTH=550 /DNA_ID=CAMNT_0039015489 /DNA_START=300 /DNA_END=1952 /DNA_ORIENTATION=+